MDSIIIVPLEKIEAIEAGIKELQILIKKNHVLDEKNRWISKKEAMSKLQVCLKTFDSYLLKGIIPYSRFAGKIYIKASDIESHLERNYIHSK